MVLIKTMISLFLCSVEAVFIIVVLFSLSVQVHASSEGYQYAKELTKKRKWPEAIVLLRNQLRENPDNLEVLRQLSGALVQAGRREEALSILNQNPRLEKELRPRIWVIASIFITQDNLQLFQEGVNFLNARKFKNAEERFSQTLEKEKDNVEILIRLGQVALMQGNLDTSVEYLKLAHKLSPYDNDVLLWLSRSLHQRGESKNAATMFSQISSNLKNDEIGVSWGAEIEYSLDNQDQAIEQLVSRFKKEPKELYTLRTLAKLKLANSSLDRQQLSLLRNQLKWALTQVDSYFDKAPKREHLFFHPLAALEIKEELQVFLGRIESRLGEI